MITMVMIIARGIVGSNIPVIVGVIAMVMAVIIHQIRAGEVMQFGSVVTLGRRPVNEHRQARHEGGDDRRE
jgi:hypothetical protein